MDFGRRAGEESGKSLFHLGADGRQTSRAVIIDMDFGFRVLKMGRQPGQQFRLQDFPDGGKFQQSRVETARTKKLRFPVGDRQAPVGFCRASVGHQQGLPYVMLCLHGDLFFRIPGLFSAVR